MEQNPPPPYGNPSGYNPPPNYNNPSQPLFQLNVDPPAHFMLRSAASWSRVMAICGILLGILFIAFAFVVQNAANNSTNATWEGFFSDGRISDSERQTAVTIYMVFFIVVGLIFLISGLFAISFSNKISMALRANDANSLRAGFAAVRNYFAFRTIILIICLLLCLLMIIGILNQPAGNGGRFD
jgi:preprotein translocase subunit SecG